MAAAMSLFLLQGTSPRALLQLERPLTSDELETVVGGIRRALAGATVRLVQRDMNDREILFGPGGTPQFVRYSYTGERVASVTGEHPGNRRPNTAPPGRFVRLIEYSGLGARYCDGAPASGGLVVEYTQNVETRRWNVRATEQDFRDAWAVLQLQMLATPSSLKISDIRNVGRNIDRGLVAPSPLSTANRALISGDPAPNPAEFQPVETLWIDARSLMPVRWEVSQREAVVSAADFVYVPLTIARPAGVELPTCIP